MCPVLPPPQVLLVQGLAPSQRQDVLLGPHQERGTHLLNALKFVAARFVKPPPPSMEGSPGEQQQREAAARSRGVLGALGGAWDPQLDGGDPERCVLPVCAVLALRGRMAVARGAASAWECAE